MDVVSTFNQDRGRDRDRDEDFVYESKVSIVKSRT